MSDQDYVQLEWTGSIATIRLNDPSTRNALTLARLAALGQALDQVVERASCMIVTGGGGAFCSGASLSGGMTEGSVDDEDFDGGHILETHLNPLMSRLRGLSIPWITAVRGAAAGFGASIALAGDIIIASETAYFAQAFSRIGLVPDGGATHLLVRTIGRPRAMQLMLTGEKLPAETALAWGLINRVVPDGDLEREAMALATQLDRGPYALRLIRALGWAAIDAGWTDALAAERDAQRLAGRTLDFREGVAAFLEKRAPVFEGR